MSVLNTILLYGVVPAAGLALIAVLTMARPSARGTRWRSGGEWEHEPLWWMGNPRGSGVPEPTVEAVPTGSVVPHTARGGARGTW